MNLLEFASTCKRHRRYLDLLAAEIPGQDGFEDYYYDMTARLRSVENTLIAAGIPMNEIVVGASLNTSDFVDACTAHAAWCSDNSHIIPAFSDIERYESYIDAVTFMTCRLRSILKYGVK